VILLSRGARALRAAAQRLIESLLKWCAGKGIKE